jgi:hypothetical protein
MRHAAPHRGKSGLALRPRPEASFAAGNSALSAAQFSLGLLGQLRSIDFLARAERDQAGKANVNADAIASGTLDGRQLDVKDGVPLATLARQDCRLRLAGQFAMPSHLDFARYTNEPDLAGFAERETIANTELRSVKVVAGLETRETCLFAALNPIEERLEGLIDPAHDLLFSGRRPPMCGRSRRIFGSATIWLLLFMQLAVLAATVARWRRI